MEHFQRLSSSVQEMCGIMTAKAEASKLDQLDEQLKSITRAMDKKAEAAQLKQLEQEMRALHAGPEASPSATNSVGTELLSLKDAISSELRSLRAGVESRAEAALVEKLRADVDVFREAVAAKAESNVVDQLNERLRSLTTSLTQKAEFTEFEQLKHQVSTLQGGTMQKVDEHRAGLKRMSQQLHEALSGTVGAQEVEKKLYDMEQRVEKLDQTKASGETVESLTGQLKVLSDMLSPKIRAASPRPRPGSARARARP
mmetsp:Transcript_63268/g.168972  ORF Transcript_63268/g.168972 Transcript_63268/m.168972 type:complete len:257 (-) Transcript_63268:93-863(-)